MLKSGKICKNNDHTCLFHCINTCRVPRTIFEHGPVFKQLPRGPANVNAWKNMYESYILHTQDQQQHTSNKHNKKNTGAGSCFNLQKRKCNSLKTLSCWLTLSTLQTEKNVGANNVDPDEMAHHMSHLIWIYTICVLILLFSHF